MMRWVLPLVSLCGCADVTVAPARGPDAPGVHFFLPKPYLLFWWERAASSKGAGADALVPRCDVIYLPDLSQRYAITHDVFLAKGDLSCTLRDGWMLGSINGGVDTSEFLAALKGLGSPAVQAMAWKSGTPPEGTEARIPPPVLYEPIWSDERGTYEFKTVRLEMPAR